MDERPWADIVSEDDEDAGGHQTIVEYGHQLTDVGAASREGDGGGGGVAGGRGRA